MIPPLYYAQLFVVIHVLLDRDKYGLARRTAAESTGAVRALAYMTSIVYRRPTRVGLFSLSWLFSRPIGLQSRTGKCAAGETTGSVGRRRAAGEVGDSGRLNGGQWWWVSGVSEKTPGDCATTGSTWLALWTDSDGRSKKRIDD
uniref:Uncharacterized protein n=1 Tax=Plectus sambesii TaxID=2011161 RepID=A0A914WNY9_9BILA